MHNNYPSDIYGVPWPFGVLIEDLSDPEFFLDDIGRSLEYGDDPESRWNEMSMGDMPANLRESQNKYHMPRNWTLQYGISRKVAVLPDGKSRPSAHGLAEDPEPFHLNTWDQCSVERSIIDAIIQMVDEEDESAFASHDISSNSSPLISGSDGFTGNISSLQSRMSMSSHSDTSPDLDDEDDKSLNFIFSPRPRVLTFPVVTVDCAREKNILYESPKSNHLLFPSSSEYGESCYGVFLSSMESSPDMYSHNLAPLSASTAKPTILTPSPRHPLPAWFH